MRTLACSILLSLGVALSGCHSKASDGDEDLGLADLSGADLSQAQSNPDFDTTQFTQDLGPGTLDVEPSTLQTITVTAGAMTPTVAFTATWNGEPITAAWVVDRGDIASLPTATSTSVAVTPRGTTGGLVTLTAGVNGQTVKRQVQVLLTSTQNGATNNTAEQTQIPPADADMGTITAGGGIGGVGGEGLGGAVTDQNAFNAFGSPSAASTKQLTLLYPYNGTVFPRGMLAPLLMWQADNAADADADAIQIQLSTTSGSFSWSGTFAKPAYDTAHSLPFIRSPIPQDVWTMATDSAGGPTPTGGVDQLTVKLTIEKGGVAYGPLTETWKIAPAHLSGIIYYQSYGTQLAQNLTGAVGGNGKFGGAILSIHVGDTAPKLAAGANGDSSDCRVCHSVSADGSRLIAQWGNNGDVETSQYAITPSAITETPMKNNITFAGLTPDGKRALSQGASLVDVVGDTVLTASAVPTVATSIGPAAFSPKGTSVAFNPMSTPTVKPTQKLVTMSYDPTAGFASPVTVADYSSATSANSRPGWPSFLPDSESIVFQHQLGLMSVSDDTENGGPSSALYTRKGATAQIEWTNVTDSTHVTPLNALNGLDSTGTSYLPKLPAPITLTCTADTVPNTTTPNQVGGIYTSHENDAQLNYEPTVNPVASGGYAWIVFTSRRLYGNEATIPPFCSDPRGVDLVKNITTKKIWVAAIDLNAPPGTDVSHPAFYLPAQELLAGNSRAFWVLDPCQADGTSCETGDQCCNGYCEPNSSGANVCSNTIPNNSCAMVQDKCATAADCCDATNTCTNNFCTVASSSIQ